MSTFVSVPKGRRGRVDWRENPLGVDVAVPDATPLSPPAPRATAGALPGSPHLVPCRVPGCLRLVGSAQDCDRRLEVRVCGTHRAAAEVTADGSLLRFCTVCQVLEPLAHFGDGDDHVCLASSRRQRRPSARAREASGEAEAARRVARKLGGRGASPAQSLSGQEPQDLSLEPEVTPIPSGPTPIPSLSWRWRPRSGEGGQWAVAEQGQAVQPVAAPVRVPVPDAALEALPPLPEPLPVTALPRAGADDEVQWLPLSEWPRPAVFAENQRLIAALRARPGGAAVLAQIVGQLPATLDAAGVPITEAGPWLLSLLMKWSEQAQ